jgi:hypothetical protein
VAEVIPPTGRGILSVLLLYVVATGLLAWLYALGAP